MTRGISTVLDAALFLLLVSAAATTLTYPAVPPASPDADAPATTLRTATATVDYSLASGVRHADPASPVHFQGTDVPGFDRTVHGGLAGLAADAAVRNLTVGDEQVTHASDGFERAVARTVANETGPRTHVVARWQPYPGAPVAGRLSAGTPAPPNATVASETMTLPSGGPATRDRALAAANRSGYEGVARVVAAGVVETALPPSKLRLSLRGDYPADALAAHRYWRAGHLLDVEATPGADEVETTNDRLADALADRLERDVRKRFDSPVAAARAVRVETVDLVVRRWDP